MARATKAAPRSRPRTRTPAPKAGVPALRNPYQEVAKKTSATFQLFRDDFVRFHSDDTQEPFERLLKKYGSSTTWIYVAVSRIASAAAQIPVQLIYKDREGQPNSVVRVYDRGLRRLLDQPNPYQSWMEFIETCSTSLSLTGNLFIEKVDISGNERPEEWYALNPGRITIVGTPKTYIQGYSYTVNGKSIALPLDKVLHVKYTHPYNDYYGLAPLTAARLAIEMDRSAMEWNRTFLLKGGWPGGAIESPESLGEDEQRRLKREIKSALSQGKDTAGRILLLTNGLKYNPIAINPKDADWADSRRMCRDEILSIYGVPYAVASLFSTEQTTARSAGVEQQIKQFYRGTVCAHLKRLLDAFNRDIVPAFSDNFKLVPDLRGVPALADDVETELKRAQTASTLIRVGFPINQVLARMYPDMQPVPWGDVYFINQASVAVNGPFNPVVQEPSGKPLEISGPTGNTPPEDEEEPEDGQLTTLSRRTEALLALKRIQQRVLFRIPRNNNGNGTGVE